MREQLYVIRRTAGAFTGEELYISDITNYNDINESNCTYVSDFSSAALFTKSDAAKIINYILQSPTEASWTAAPHNRTCIILNNQLETSGVGDTNTVHETIPEEDDDVVDSGNIPEILYMRQPEASHTGFFRDSLLMYWNVAAVPNIKSGDVVYAIHTKRLIADGVNIVSNHMRYGRDVYIIDDDSMLEKFITLIDKYIHKRITILDRSPHCCTYTSSV